MRSSVLYASSSDISIPQRSDLNVLVILSQDTSTFISIPQRSDLNSCLYQIHSVFYRISIPQRSDLNMPKRKVMGLMTLYFNPATVWFELCRSSIIWSWFLHFNPATVWFEPSSYIRVLPYKEISIPQRSDLNQARRRQIRACLPHKHHNQNLWQAWARRWFPAKINCARIV